MLTVNTLIADKQNLFCEGIKTILSNYPAYELNMLSHVDSSDQVISIISTMEIDLLIMDLNLSGMDGIDLIPRIRKISKDIKILVLTTYNDHKFVKESMKGGADGYLLKSHKREDLFAALNNIFNERTYLGPDVHITPPSGFKINSKAKTKFEDRFLIKRKLTKREHEVLSLITQAKNNKEIAVELFISDQTVGVHRKNIMRKLGVRNTVNLIKFAFENSLVK